MTLILLTGLVIMNTELYIKNMVCDRCVMAVRDVLVRHGLSPVSVELGHAVIDGSVDDASMESIGKDLESIGFELLNDKKERIVEK